MKSFLKIIFFILWCGGVIWSVYLFKKTINDVSDINELYGYSFFYAGVILAVTLAFLPVVMQSRSE